MIKNNSHSMSTAAQFMSAALIKSKGGTTTRARLKSTFNCLAVIAKDRRWTDLSPSNLTAKQLAQYVQIRIGNGISSHSIQTDISSIRRAFIGAGRNLDVLRLFNSQALGVPSFSRTGTGIAVDELLYLNALSKADICTASLMRLQHDLGLRMSETLATRDSLKSWHQALLNGVPGIAVTAGTKGGRHRTICVHHQMREAAIGAIVASLAATRSGKIFAISEADSPRKARKIYNDRLAEIGLKGDQSSHSLRRRFAINQYKRYLADGYEEKSALALLANDLGHGDSRGRWVLNNYIGPTLKIERGGN